MKNYNQCECGLVYNEFSIILIQTFTSPGIEIPDSEKPEVKSFIKKDNEGNYLPIPARATRGTRVHPTIECARVPRSNAIA